MKTLNTIQTLSKIGKVLSKIIYICAICVLLGNWLIWCDLLQSVKSGSHTVRVHAPADEAGGRKGAPLAFF